MQLYCIDVIIIINHHHHQPVESVRAECADIMVHLPQWLVQVKSTTECFLHDRLVR